MRYEYSLPAEVGAADIVDALRQRCGLTDLGGQRWEICYFDTFDWRLYKEGLILEEHRNGAANHLHWRAVHNGSPERVLPNTRMPHFASELPPGAFRERLARYTEPRALLPQAIIHTHAQSLQLENDDGKTLLRVVLETGRLLHCDHSRTAPVVSRRLRVEPLRGYEKYCRSVRREVARLGLTEARCDLLVEALAFNGRRPAAYDVRPKLTLAPDSRTDEAVRRLLRACLDVMKRNLPGIEARTDCEFLHDFRTALRRIRALLPELAGVFPKRTVDRFRRDTRWLGDITSSVRDLDVLALALDDYAALIDDDDARAAFRARCGVFVEREVELAYERLNERLQSARFTRLMAALEEFLESPVPRRTPLEHAMRDIRSFASERLARRLRKLRKGATVAARGDDPEKLHQVRILAKRCRYLLDAFQSLYPKRPMRTLRDALKRAQDTLGAHHDCYVHELALRQLAERMRMEEALDADLAAAFETLFSRLAAEQHRLAQEAAARLRAFGEADTKALCDRLFAAA